MLCKYCNNNCNNSCKSSIVSREIKINNNSLGRDGESAYLTYVRLGGTLTEAEWSALQLMNIYQEDKWV